MRMKILFTAKDNKFPLQYRVVICSLIKNALEKADEEYFKSLYYYNGKKNKKIKPFTFSVFLKDYEIRSYEINLKGRSSITISTSDYNLGINLYNGLIQINNYGFKDYEINIEKLILEKESIFTGNEVICKTLSPIHLKNKSNKPISPTSYEFEETLNYISDVLLKTIRGEGLQEKLIFTPINMKKVVVKERIKDFKDITNKDIIYIESYSGSFKLSGNREDIKVLIQTGLGNRRSFGFGMIDIL